MLINESSDEFTKMTWAVQNRMGGGVPDVVAKDAIKESYRRFCEDTETWIILVPQTISSTQVVYSAVGNYAVNARRIVGIKIKNTGDTRSFEELPTISSSWYSLIGNSVKFNQDARITSHDGCSMQIITAAVPTRANFYMESDLYEMYANAIEYGAIMELASQIGRPWYSENMFAMYRSEFFKEECRAIADMKNQFKDESRGFRG